MASTPLNVDIRTTVQGTLDKTVQNRTNDTGISKRNKQDQDKRLYLIDLLKRL